MWDNQLPKKPPNNSRNKYNYVTTVQQLKQSHHCFKQTAKNKQEFINQPHSPYRKFSTS